MQNLPPELLSSIFQTVAPQYHCDLYDSSYLTHTSRLQRSVLTLALVCQYWRAVAHGFPTLWSVIEVKKEVPWAQTKAWLERAKGGALDVIILVDRRCSFRPDFLSAMDALANRKGQWRSLFIHGSSSSEQFLKSLLPESLPHLQTVVLCDPNQSPTTPVVSTPELRSLATSGIPMFFDHCATLRRITLDTPYGAGTWKSCTDFVASCEALETLELRRIQFGDLLDMDGHIEALTSKSLVDLRLLECSDDTASAILRHTTATSIKRLCIGGMNNLMRGTKSPPPDILERLPGLRTICILIAGTEYVCRVIRAILGGIDREQMRRLTVQMLDVGPSPTMSLGKHNAFAGNVKFLTENCTLK
ncbi:hypothetical protein FRB94_008275 [Tulasnella sp. JGI-2019a]|nr:hypothetical protein FRB94_008275 [Tulasnella sp. JGI-2019a]KAG9004912.1 hypothetical protein FRB93_010091 [Tulasnella sp. JGI-2019a]KAG9027626.1 hypothetical protein FRB95_007560 [Tulasnella sp. JGI-2019a]